ncbi:MAG: hypothetical protein HN742_35005 [Lentisphaerae bacterium]|nr:hypothetical protein [Lentisphaerota bacterium]MBT4822383.1 hypothetical protein [Lentisphaerota bacterium]MBT5609221.1 hypothetical protein [Lentisphaerota bacterium]MBT7059900.1 hypothetical protein [Lentisphaerota bacterium]MBT7847133.1 hypothetical protein [Lentisphaerota bacterium]
MLLGLVVYVALFLVLFGTSYSVQEGIKKDAFWGLILAWWFGALTVALGVVGFLYVDPFYTTILILFSIMRFGMEQADHQRRVVSDGALEARKELLKAVRVMDLYDKIRDHVSELPEESRLGHFIRLRISDTSLGRASLSFGLRLSAPLALLQKLAGFAPRVIVGVNQNPAASLLYWLCGISLICTTGAKIVYIASGGDARAEHLQIIQDSEAYETACKTASGQHLGHLLGTEFSGTKTLLVTKSPSLTDGEGDSAFQKGLAEGLAANAPVSGEATVPRPTPPEVTDRGVRVEKAFDYLTPAFFDETVATHPQCGLIVSTTGLPKELGKLRFWKKKSAERPKVVLINTPLVPLLKPLKLGLISAIVVNHPNMQGRIDLVGRQPKEVFEASYLVVRAENVEEVQRQHPLLFPLAR